MKIEGVVAWGHQEDFYFTYLYLAVLNATYCHELT